MADEEVQVTFRVTLEDVLSSGQTLFIVGDCPELGQWKPRLAKALQLVSKTSDSEIWVGSFAIAADSILYRFFMGSVQEKKSTAEDIVVVHTWETLPNPRHLRVVKSGMEDVETTYGRSNGSACVERGWLTGQTAIHLSLHNDALRFLGSVSPSDRYFLNCLPIETKASNGRGVDVIDTNDSHSYARGSTIATEIFVSVLDGASSAPRVLPPEGVKYRPSDLASFRIETWSPEHLAFKIVVSADETTASGTSLKEIGSAFVDPVDLTSSKRFISASILSRDGEIIGHLKIHVLIIKSLDYDCDMSDCVGRFQKPSPDRAWFIGHRGMGSTIKGRIQCAVPGKKENTISSLAQAVRHGADFVEFDVMLSKDRKPVLHHDFVTSISARGKVKGVERRIDIPVQHLDQTELESLHTHAVGVSQSEESRDPEDDDPFPLLRSCLEKVDPRAGFNVEVKYCMRLRSGDLEDGIIHFPCRNDYVDDILRVLLRHSGERRVILSSFDPDVCSMMRAKQNRYPVIFLTQGDTKKYLQYEDPRTWDAETAIQFAVADSLRGICVHTESLLRDPGLIEKGKRSGLWVVCWGEDNSSRENVKFLMEKGVDGIIVDRIDEFIVC